MRQRRGGRSRQGWEAQYCHMAKGSLSVSPGDDGQGRRYDRAGRPVGNDRIPAPAFHPAQGRQAGRSVRVGARGDILRRRTAPVGARASGDAGLSGGSVLNKGFAAGPVTMEAVELRGSAGIPKTGSPALVAYVRAIGLKGGDSQVLTLCRSGRQEARQTRRHASRPRQGAMDVVLRRQSSPRRLPAGLYRAIYRSCVMENRPSSRHSPSSSNPDLTRGSARPPPPRRFRPRRKSATARSGSGTAS